MAKRPCGGSLEIRNLMQDQQSTRPPDLPSALSGPMRILRDAVASLEAGRAEDVHVRAVTASLISTWRLIERDPGFEVAAADLLAAARQLASPVQAAAPVRLRRLLREAQARLNERLASARVATDRICAAPVPSMVEHLHCQALPAVDAPVSRIDGSPALLHEVAVLDDITAAQITALARSLAPRMAA